MRANKIIFMAIATLCGFSSVCSAQAPETLWVKTYGPEGFCEAEGYSVKETEGGGFIAAGGIYTSSYYDAYFVRVDADGDTIWTKHYDSDPTYENRVHSIINNPDGGFVATGYRSYTTWTISLGVDGDSIWARSYGVPGAPEAHDILQDRDGNYVITGYTQGSYMYLAKLDPNGSLLWQRTFNLQDPGGPITYQRAYAVLDAGDGDYVLAGYRSTHGNDYSAQLCLVKVTGDTVAWRKTYGGGDWDDVGLAAAHTLDGGYIVAGYTGSYGPGSPLYGNGYVVRTDAAGDSLWTRHYYVGSGETTERIHSVQPTPDGGFVFAGYTVEYGSRDFWIFKTDAVGDVEWMKTLDVGGNDHARDIQVLSDGGYIVTGIEHFLADGNLVLVRLAPEPDCPEPIDLTAGEDVLTLPPVGYYRFTQNETRWAATALIKDLVPEPAASVLQEEDVWNIAVYEDETGGGWPICFSGRLALSEERDVTNLVVGDFHNTPLGTYNLRAYCAGSG